MEYHLIGYRENDLVRLDVLINSERADPLTTIVHKDNAYGVGKGLVEKLKELIPKQQFKIPLQASMGVGSLLVKVLVLYEKMFYPNVTEEISLEKRNC